MATLHVPPRPRHRPSPICVCPSFLLFFLFFRKKKRDVLFFLFFQKKKRKNQRKETLTGWGMNRSHRAALFRLLFFIFPCGAFQRKAPQNIFCRQRQAPLTGGRSGPTQAGSRLSFLVLFSFPGKKREQTKTGQRAVI